MEKKNLFKTTQMRHVRPFYIESKDYDQFDFYEDNRDVTNNHVKKLAKSFQEFGQLVPIVCKDLYNGKLKIIDGQFRFTAAKNLGIPIKYMIDNNLKNNDVTEINITQKKFTNLDWIKRYSKQNLKDYKLLLLQIESYKKTLGLSSIIELYHSTKNNVPISTGLRNGKYKIDVKKGNNLVNIILKCYATVQNKNFLKRTFCRAIQNFYLKNQKEFDLKHFLKNLSVKKLNVYSLTSDTIEEIKNVYNYNLKKNRIV